MPSYIEKIQVPVRVVQPGAENISGYFAVAPQAEQHDGPESVLDLLNAPTRMLPFVRAADGTVLLVSRLGIDWIEADASVEQALVRPRSYLVTREERVQVRLGNGRRIEGLLQMELPEQYNRASDFLNSAEDFFALLTPGTTVLVNKVHVSGVRLYEASPEPIESGAPGR